METWVDIPDFLRTLQGERILYAPNPGNGGDALIAEATYQLFERIGIELEPWQDDSNPEGAVVLLSGGGNFVPYYRDIATVMERVHRDAKRLILLPHTVWGHEKLLAELGRNVDLFCRERKSYAHVSQFARGANVHLGADMALTLDTQSILGGNLSSPEEVFKRKGLKRKARQFHLRLEHRSRLAQLRVRLGVDQDRVAYCFRKDAEKTNAPRPMRNFDLSHQVPRDNSMKDRAVVRYTSREFLRYLDRFDRVETNRLHVAIGAALLGKGVSFYPNSYWKNQAVFEATLRLRFPNIEWRGPPEEIEMPPVSRSGTEAPSVEGDTIPPPPPGKLHRPDTAV